MSFATSSSAFGLKPTTTSAAAPTNMFGQPIAQQSVFSGGSTAPAQNAFSNFAQQNQQQNAPVFGQTSTAAPSAFGQAQQQQPAAGQSLFGGQQQQQQQTPSLFGQTNNQQQSNAFGQSTQQQQQPSAFGGGTSIFGQSNQQPAASGTTSLFGQSTQAPSLFGQSTQPAAGSTNLFGQSTNQQQQQPSTNLFGQSTGTGSSLFGGSTFGQNNQSQQQQQQQPANSLFGGSTQPAGGAFGTSLFNKPQQSLAPSPQNSAPLFTKSTKFNDLNDQLRKQFEDIEAHIQGRIQISKELTQRNLGEEPRKSIEPIRALNKDLVGIVSMTRADKNHKDDLNAKTSQAVEDTLTAMRIIDAYKTQQMNHQHLKDHASFPFEFFSRLSKQMRERLIWCNSVIEQIERKLASMANQSQYTPHGISTTLQAQHSIFLALASKTAVLDAELQKIKALYTQMWQKRMNSVRSPFNELDTDRNVGHGKSSDLGLSGLSVR